MVVRTYDLVTRALAATSNPPTVRCFWRAGGALSTKMAVLSAVYDVSPREILEGLVDKAYSECQAELVILSGRAE